MQATLKKPVDIKDAYIDALILNVYSGPGQNEIWIDDLEIGPVMEPTSPFRPIKLARTPGFRSNLFELNGATRSSPARPRA